MIATMGIFVLSMSFFASFIFTGSIYGKLYTETSEYDMDISTTRQTHSTDMEYVTDCDRAIKTLTCKAIPKKIPAGVTNVIVTTQDRLFIPENQFQDKSWTLVDSLHIQDANCNLRKGNLFEGLANLTNLFLNCSDTDRIDRSYFAGLESLTNLTLAGMDILDGSSLQSAMSNENVLPEMKYFTLNPGETLRSLFMKMQYPILKSFANKEMKCLNLCNVIIEMQPKDIVFVFLEIQSLQVLNFTGSFMIIDTAMKEGYMNSLHAYFSRPLVKTLDTSSFRISYAETESNSNSDAYDTDRLGKHYISPEVFLVETWFTNNIYIGRTDVQGIQDYSSHRMFWKKVVCTGNNIGILNATYLFPPNNTLRHLDLSENRMEYIGPGTFITMFELQELSLSNNQLFHMEHVLEFEDLLKTLKNLRVFDLGRNSISFIPTTMFASNTLLEILILANNRLRSISFDFGHLMKLRELDLRGNMIKTLNKNELNNVRMFVNGRHGQLDVRFQDNSIECSCETRGFISWLETLQHISKEKVQCSYEGDTIDINNDAVGKCNYLCNRTTIIAVSTTCSLAAAVIFLCAFVKIKRMRDRKKMKNVEWVLKDSIQAGNFVCFVAMSGNDEDLVNRVILKTLRQYLQGKVNLDRDVVCTGNRFKPGFSICEESYRLLNMSHVFIAVVSDTFLRSQYCRLELQEACKQNKPIILIFLGIIDTEDMPQYMQEVFRRNSRAWIKQNDEGYYYVVPGLRDIGDAIWDLAILDLIQQGLCLFNVTGYKL